MDSELTARVEILDRMIARGAEETSYWGWAFVLWGFGQLGALFWTAASHRPGLAWGTTMSVCGVLTIAGALLTRNRDRKVTALSHALQAIWASAAIALVVAGAFGGGTGMFGPRAFAFAIVTIYGLANCASGMILRWRVQEAVAIGWWACAITIAFGSGTVALWVFAGALVVGNVFFGIYLIVLERRRQRIA